MEVSCVDVGSEQAVQPTAPAKANATAKTACRNIVMAGEALSRLSGKWRHGK